MAVHRSLDENEIIAALLRDVFTTHEVLFNYRSRKNTLNKVRSRLESEGLGFLTKTLPRLGKAIDRALAGGGPLDVSDLRLATKAGSKLPLLLGELFEQIFSIDGEVLQEPCIQSVSSLRQFCYLYYKYELPYTKEQEQQVVDSFVKTEDDLSTITQYLDQIKMLCDEIPPSSRLRHSDKRPEDVVRQARILLSSLFASFDPTDIRPRHGPGAVATKQRLWDKYRWTNISSKITQVYPLDSYFYASIGHLCDQLQEIPAIGDADLPARVCLVPKDSRGPRLISCEPVDFQWVQQGLGRAIVEHVERHSLTKENVFFTNQQPNQFGALLGSHTGEYATLDLKEASDRVSVSLVRLLWPSHIYEYLVHCRSSSTILPDGSRLELTKFAPMGSCLCFPVMAITIWAILTAGLSDRRVDQLRKEPLPLLVYGDDVVVQTAKAEDAIKLLSSFGLKINRDKSCIKGSFRESCGTDAFKGVSVTPVRLRTVWSSSPTPESYSSWVAYANSFWDKKYFNVYETIVENLFHTYGSIPSCDMNLSCPSLREVPVDKLPKKSRTNHHLQKRQWKVWDVKAPAQHHVMDGWSMLLRYFAESSGPLAPYDADQREESRELTPWEYFSMERLKDPHAPPPTELMLSRKAISVSSYTQRRASILVRRWR